MSTKNVLMMSGAVILFSILLEFILLDPHGKFWWHNLLGFDAMYGFLGCTLIIVLSKKLGKLFIQKDEHFYGGGDKRDD